MKTHLLLTFGLLSTFALAMPAQAENLTHVRQLLSTGQCRGCDLSRSGLTYANLINADLRDADLRGANLSRANLSYANLQGAKLSGAALNGAILEGANLRDADLQGVDLRDVYFVGADLRNANLVNAVMKGAIGLPNYVLNVAELHNWGVQEAQRGKHKQAIEYYSQAIGLQPNLAIAYLSRSISRGELGDYQLAMEDAKQAGVLFQAQDNPQGYETTQKLVQVLEKAATGNGQSGQGFGNQLVNFVGSLLGLFL